LDLGALRTNDLSSGTAEDLHQFLTLLLRVIATILVVTFDYFWLGFGDVGTILLIALVCGGTECIDNVLKIISFMATLVLCFFLLHKKMRRHE
jgi:uncharacterized membrane protein